LFGKDKIFMKYFGKQRMDSKLLEWIEFKNKKGKVI